MSKILITINLICTSFFLVPPFCNYNENKYLNFNTKHSSFHNNVSVYQKDYLTNQSTIIKNKVKKNKNIFNSDLREIEYKIHRLINHHRQNKYHLPALQLSDTLSIICRKHSKDMGVGKVPFSHDGFDKRTDEIARYINYSFHCRKCLCCFWFHPKSYGYSI